MKKNKKVCDICKEHFTDRLPCDIKDCPMIPIFKFSLKFLNVPPVLHDEGLSFDEEISLDEVISSDEK